MQETIKIDNNKILNELKTFPNQGVLWEIINYNKTGKIFELSKNAILIIENSNEPFIFIAGNLVEKDIEDIIDFLQNYKSSRVISHPKYHHIFLKRDYNFHLRCEFKLVEFSSFEVADFSIKIEKIDDITLFKKCLKYKSMSEGYKSDQNFLDFGIGYAMLKDDHIISEAYISIGNGYGEIGVITHPSYRRRGYGLEIVSHVIKKLLEKNITPIWSCNVDNKASFFAAIKLGFIPNFYYTLLVPDFGNVLCSNLGNWIENNSYSQLFDT